MRAAILVSVSVLTACASAPAPATPAAPEPADAAPLPPPATPCPASVLARFEAADLGSAANSALFATIAAEAIDCQVAALRVVAGRLDAASDPQVIADFCSTAATLARFLPAGARDDVQSAYRRLPYHDSIHADYFAGLRANRIDIRPRLRGQLAEDWSFAHPRRGAATWHYYLYLASLDEPGAYLKLAAKIAATSDGNDVTNLLTSLAELGSEPARDIVLGYASDPRTADGPSGPALTVAATVARLLAQHFAPRPG